MYAKIASENDPFSLVIVESPAKAGTIAKYLNANSEHRYVVHASMGHVRDLPQSARQTNLLPAKFRDSKWATLGIDLDSSTFDPMYITLPDKIKHVRELQDLSKSAEEVILATDEDREGEVRVAMNTIFNKLRCCSSRNEFFGLWTGYFMAFITALKTQKL